MSGAAEGDPTTTKAVVNDSKNGDAAKEKDDAKKPAAQLGEDDEFEDFPVEDWGEEDMDDPGANQHLWSESWDDDDTSDDFSKQLKEELKKQDTIKEEAEENPKIPMEVYESSSDSQSEKDKE
ncbi:MAG: hypothetical protein M1820_009487 [Bogoriella megaspora]|nr:MAG: hypothetical protein M1820_009487 [Bogoriella megaspora]